MILGSIVIDEMKLSEGISLDKRSKEFRGFVDLGEFTPRSQKDEPGDHALVFLFQPFKGYWIQVFGAFLSKGCCTSEILQKLLIEGIILLEQAGFFVDAVVADGASWNRAVWTALGIDENNVSCEHPCDPERRLRFISDFSHLVKCARNGFFAQGKFLVITMTII